jgi:predicted flap endonuclease-1-like 5' DNA nuclease
LARKIDEIEGIGPANAEKLVASGCATCDALLAAGATRPGRAKLAEATGFSEKQILSWVNMADLFRIHGVAGQFAELLEASGVDTVKELRTRNAENLAYRMAEVNGEKKLCKADPSASQIQGWIDQAQILPPTVEY